MQETKAQMIEKINVLKVKTTTLLDSYRMKKGKNFDPKDGTNDPYMGLVVLDESDKKVWMRFSKSMIKEQYDWFTEYYNFVSKSIKEESAEDYQPINMDEYLEEKEARDRVAEIQIKHGRYEVQDVQKYNNTTAAIFLGVQEINTKLSGWDGRKDGKIPFEQKCNGLMSSHNLNGIYQDTSDSKLNRLSSGGLACNTAYIANGWIAYMVVYNTKMIVDILKNNRNNARKSGVISLNQVLDAGGKIVACQYSVKDTYADIIRHYPRLKHHLSEKDIHPASESKKIANEMAYWVEPTPLW